MEAVGPSDGEAGPSAIAIVGPTAIGKTSAAIAAARLLDAEVISADSMAVYRGCDIGSAKPTLSEQAACQFHGIDIVAPVETLGAAQFRVHALEALEEILGRGRRAIICGGSGLYVRALLDGLAFTSVPAQPAIRDRIRSEASVTGVPALHRRLAVVDPAAAERIHPNDLVRIERALEVFEVTGIPISEQQRADRAARSPLRARRYGLRMAMDALDERIDARVADMFAQGLVDEVNALWQAGVGPDTTAMGGLGYKEVLSALMAGEPPTEAVEQVKRNTRRFARRQMTWFRADRQIRWLDVDGMTTGEIAAWIVAAEQEPEHRPGSAPQS